MKKQAFSGISDREFVTSETIERRLAAIFAADMVGFSSQVQVDEEGTPTRLKQVHAELIAPEIAARHGRIFKMTGDGFLAEFTVANWALTQNRANAERLANDRQSLIGADLP